MGQTETKYRITSTKVMETNKSWDTWEGFCVVVTKQNKHVVFPNGEKYPCIQVNSGLRITEGPHKGFYECNQCK